MPDWHARIAALALCTVLWSCGPARKAERRTDLVLWKNQAGLDEEEATREMVARFNASQSKWRVVAQSLPQGGYDQSIVAASLADRMPCIVAVDSPMVASYAWAGHVRPLDGYVAPANLDQVSRAAVGRYAGKVYAVGQFDAALAIFTRKSILAETRTRVPTLERPWTLQEFQTFLERLKASGRYRYPLDLATRDDKASWWTYAFSPMLQSFGGDLIDRRSMRSAEGALNGAAAQRFGSWFQALFAKGLVNRKEPDESAFVKGRAAVVYTGGWWAPDYRRYAGDDLAILPPPDFGTGVVIGGGSWQWAISKHCAHPEGAGSFINFILQPSEVAAMSDRTGNVPVTAAGAARSRDFNPDGKSRIFYELMERFARGRPATPAFSVVSNAFTFATRDIMDGKDVADALDDAVDDIDGTIADNPGLASAGGE
ncbi:extracellular solute-binding protein [Sphingomonas sp. NIBR02145]|uniref:extracellular solute-binding protein n=1 Tax=Sphingomonas sp. NIBR02145 TaxID=3014784 RepID=UPI0022B3D4D8|nr:extracellular solute-binding protein [Sphingomonas sp. NIBR02145]WHU04293.1 extracellular solute-binding protein [Sphingomonas sp. NIBR02145]